MRQRSPLATIRTTPEVILWALAIFVSGVVVLPLVHLVGHRADHVHGLVAHARAHAAGLPHDDAGPGHGTGELAHFGVAVIDAAPPVLAPPAARLDGEVRPVVPMPPPVAARWTPIRPGAP